MNKFNDYLDFLYNIGSISEMDKVDLMKHCINIQFPLEVGDTKDINGWELFDEFVILCEIIEKDTLPLKVLEKIFSFSADEIFCNVSIVLRILLTMPITTASAEQSFSKMNFIKKLSSKHSVSSKNHQFSYNICKKRNCWRIKIWRYYWHICGFKNYKS